MKRLRQLPGHQCAATLASRRPAGTTNGALIITVTGVAATTIRWVADIETVEVVG